MFEPFERVKAAVLGARGLRGEARAAFLDEACAGDDALRAEVESLLAHADAPVTVLETAAAIRLAGPHALAGPDSGVATGTAGTGGSSGAPPPSVGPYVIHGVLGEGGMGTVYEAEQFAPIRRRVALKLIRRGLDTDAVLARFTIERKALELMDHPAIARVLDAGASDDGRPYFVMELVDGVPITHACRDRQLAVRDMLRLFVAVCQGVRHAHQKGIVHRDLKPSNVLVRDVDGLLEPKIIDFGIAKAIDAPAGDGPEPVTRLGGPIGTPDYMSPEQAGLIPGGVDTRTDVYSLGVLLYEILTGDRPYRFGASSPHDVARALSGPEPPRPSLVAPGRRRQLAGDLDNIVARAMARQPAERYASVEQFADDIRRHLEGEPVLAREATWVYRAEKFVRRHPAGVAGAASLAVLAVGAGVTFAVQARRLARERDRAREAERGAREQAVTAESVVRFLVDLFQTSDPSEARGNTITAREVLDRGAQQIESGLRESPKVQATLLTTLARVYESLGLYAVAQPFLERALAQRIQLFGREDAGVAETMGQLAALHRKRGDYDGAEPLFREALAIQRRTLGPDHPQIADTISTFTHLLRTSDRTEEAEALAREAVAMRLRLFGPDRHEVAESLHALGATLWRRGDFAGAEHHLRQAIEIDTRVLGDVHPVMAVRWNTLGQVLGARGKLEEAEATLRKSVDLGRLLHGTESTAHAHNTSNLAWLLVKRGKLEEAESLLTSALALHRRFVGEENRWVIADLQGLGLVKLRAHEFTQAEQMFRRARAMATKLLGPESVLAAEAAMNLGAALSRQGRIAEAEPLLRQAEARWVQTQGAGHPDYARYAWELGLAVAARRGVDEAERLFQQALDLRRRTLPPDHPDIGDVLASLGNLRLDRGDRPGAERYLREAVGIFTTALPADAPTRIDAEQALAQCRPATCRGVFR
ncbi:MAG: tetratricopeptide repeat protein [Vicinamibacterales bacterium]